ncbi:MAG: hypothetical protein ACOC1F_12730 [Myxococcota bacterium]
MKDRNAVAGSSLAIRRASLLCAANNAALAGDVFLALIHTTLMHEGKPWRNLTALFEHDKHVEAAPQGSLPCSYEANLERVDENRMRPAHRSVTTARP